MAGAAEPDPAPRQDWEVNLGGRFIYTTGYTTWNNQAVLGLPQCPLGAHLARRGQPVTEVFVDAVFRQRLVLQGTMGIGPIYDGAFLDKDYAADDRQNLISSTRSGDGEGLLYFNMDVGFRMLSWMQPHSYVPGYLQAFGGYQFWIEYYEASGAHGTVTISVRRGGHRGDVHVSELPARGGDPGAGVPGAGAPAARGLPALDPVRSPRQAPVARRPAAGSQLQGLGGRGHGYQLEGALLYDLGNRFSVEAGYRYWRIESGDGTVKARTTSSGDVKAKLNEIIIERYGPWAGMSYRF